MTFSFPANAKFIFSLFIELTQFDIIPNDFLEESVFSFDDPEPYSPRFEDMDIFLMKKYFPLFLNFYTIRKQKCDIEFRQFICLHDCLFLPDYDTNYYETSLS